MADYSMNNVTGNTAAGVKPMPKMKSTIQPVAKYDSVKTNVSAPPVAKPANYANVAIGQDSADDGLDESVATTDTSMDMGSDLNGADTTGESIQDDDDNIDVADATDVGDDSSAASYSSNENEVTQEMGIISSVIAITLLTPIFVAGVTITGIAIGSHFNNKSLCKRFNEVTGKKTTMKDIDKYCLDASGYINEFAVNNVKPFINKMCVTGTTPELDTNRTFIGVKNEDNGRIFNDYKYASIDEIFFISTDIGFIYDKDKYPDYTIKNKISDLSKDDFYVSAYIPLNDYDEYENGMADTIKKMNKYGIVHISIMLPITKFFDRIKTKVTREAVNNIIKNSPDLITALESVGAMYCIPSSNMICDNSLKSIKVVGDCVNAPNVKNVSGNGKAIMCAIGAVLDNISQRIDDKLDTYHKNIIDDSRSNEIETLEKIAHPPFVEKIDTNKNTYFNDMDDITKGMNLNVVDNTASDNNKVDIASEIKESCDMFELYNKYGCTRNLGYKILQEQGFDYVKPSEATEFVTESAKSSSSDKKDITAADIKYMKFDNKNIIDSIKYFNEARADQKENATGHINFKQFVNHPSYKKAVACLSKQFDANIQFRFFDDKNPYNESEYTIIFDDVKNNVSISKAKGFQLNGLPIMINIIGNAIDSDAPDDISMFGQSLVSAALHEIFHNIAGVFSSTNSEFNAALNTTLSIASTVPTGRKRRIFLTNYVNTIDNFFGTKMNHRTKRILVKQLATLVSVMYNNKALNALRKSISESTDEKDIDKLINAYESVLKSEMRKRNSKAGILGFATLTAVSLLCKVIFGKRLSTDVHTLLKFSAGLSAVISFSGMLNQSALKSMDKKYKDSHDMEEYYCDLFAGMYNLPVTFLYKIYGSNKIGIPTNKLKNDQFEKLIKLEREVYQLTYSTYPTIAERNHASVKIAKNVLENNKSIDPSIKKYLQWIVDNYSNTLDSDIDEIYNSATFDPKEAEDLDKHLDNLITNNNIALTESFVSYINNDSIINE